MACSNGPLQRSSRSAVSSWNLARVSVSSRCSGPSAVAVMKGRLICVCCTCDSSILAFSAASLRRCTAILSVDRSTPCACLERLDQPVDDPLVPVVAAEVGVAVGGLDLEHAVADLEDRHVEGAAAEVEHEDRLVGALLVEAVGQGGRGGLVDDAQHLEAGDLARLLGGGALGVVEVGGDGDDGLGDGVAQVGLGVALQLLQDAGGDLLGRVLLAVDVDRSSSVPMWRLTERMVRSGLVMAWRLATSPTSTSPVLAKATTDGRGAGALGVGDDGGLAAPRGR